MAAMANSINKRRADHILTIEDPIEYVHESDSCNVTQREVGAQTESFPKALRAALREDPDVIVIGELFRYLKEKGGSDLHLLATQPPRVRIHGSLTGIEGRGVISDEEMKELLREICSEEQWLEFAACGDLDFAWALPGEARFRVNFLRQHRGVGAGSRLIPEKILTFDVLNLPQAGRDLA